MLDKWMKSENAGRECPCYQLVFSKVTHGSPHPQSLRMWLCLETGPLKRKVRFSSVTQLCPTLCNHEVQHTRPPCQSPTPRVHDDAIQPSHPLSSPSPPALSLSQHQGLFQRVSSSHQVAKVLELQHQSSKLLVIRSLTSLDPGVIVDIKQTSGYMHSILEAVECWRHNRNITSLSERWTSCS